MKVLIARALIVLILLPVFGMIAFAMIHGMPDAMEYFRSYWFLMKAYWPVPLGAVLLLAGSLSFLSGHERGRLKKMELDAYRQMDEERDRKNAGKDARK